MCICCSCSHCLCGFILCNSEIYCCLFFNATRKKITATTVYLIHPHISLKRLVVTQETSGKYLSKKVPWTGIELKSTWLNFVWGEKGHLLVKIQEQNWNIIFYSFLHQRKIQVCEWILQIKKNKTRQSRQSLSYLLTTYVFELNFVLFRLVLT